MRDRGRTSESIAKGTIMNTQKQTPTSTSRLRRSIAVALSAGILAMATATGSAHAASSATPNARAAQLASAPATPDRLIRARQVGSSAVDDYLLSVAVSSAQMWADALTKQGVSWQQVLVDIVDGNATATAPGCGTVGDVSKLNGVNPAFYCGTDNTIYLSSQWLVGQIGDKAGMAYAVSHEMGHAVQHMVGNEEHAGAPVRPWELQADCYSGIWFNVTRHGSDDATRAAEVAGVLGDDQVNDPGHHGTPAERARAFIAGWNGNDCPLDVGA